jgi:hypothetical protein
MRQQNHKTDNLLNKMKIFLRSLLPLLTVIALASCQKDINYFVPDGPAVVDTVWQNSISANMPVMSLKNDLLISKRTDNFTYNNTDIVFANGITTLTIPAVQPYINRRHRHYKRQYHPNFPAAAKEKAISSECLCLLKAAKG